jgi:hypothetical protein
MRISIVAILILMAAAVLSSQSVPAFALAGGMSDWTNQQVIFSNPPDVFTLFKIQQDPRYGLQWNRRHPNPNRLSAMASTPANSGRDWSVSLGGGSTGTQSFPAKYSFDVNAPPSCSSDFVATGINAAGSTTQANIIAVNNLYSNSAGTGYCSGTGPEVMFAYNVGPGTVPASVVISLNGKKLAFIENNGANTYFHVLTYKTGTGNGSSATSPVSPPTGADVKLQLNQGSTNSVFVDYAHDTAYATTNGTNGTMYKVSGVFLGTPALVTTGGWPITLTGIAASTPVYDSVSQRVFFKASSGTVYYVSDNQTSASLSGATWAFTTGDSNAHPVIVDSTNQRVYAYTSGGASALVGQATTNLESPVTAVVGTGLGANRTTKMPDFSNAYYSGTTTGAYLYIAGNDSADSDHPPALYKIGFNSSWVMNSTATSGPLALATNTATVDSSPVTDFYNSATGNEYLFVGVSNACEATGTTGGCVRSLNVTNGAWPSGTVNNVVLAATGGASGITVDNDSSDSQASSVYYVTMTGDALVKATQSGLQ